LPRVKKPFLPPPLPVKNPL